MTKIDSTPSPYIISFRLTFEAYRYLCEVAEQLDFTPAEYARHILQENLKTLKEHSKNG